MVRLLQDLELLNLWCPKFIRQRCDAEFSNNKQDRFVIHSLIKFILFGLGHFEMGQGVTDVRQIYQKFVNGNREQIEQTFKYYD